MYVIENRLKLLHKTVISFRGLEDLEGPLADDSARMLVYFFNVRYYVNLCNDYAEKINL